MAARSPRLPDDTTRTRACPRSAGRPGHDEFLALHRPSEHFPPFSSADLADLLRRLHRLGAPPFPILPWRPLTTLSSILDHRVAASVLSGYEIGWLRDRVQAVRDALFRISWPLGAGLIHGDAWLGNLLVEHRPGGPVLRLGDWDDVAIGPREIDLIPTWHASYRYGRGPAWRAAFRDRYGHDLEAWDGFGVLMDMRDLVQLSGPIRRAANSAPHAAALRQRARDLRTVSTATVWTAL